MIRGRPPLRVRVIGGSLGGLSTAVLLTKLGYEVDVYERARHPLEGRGAGIVLHPSTVRPASKAILDASARAVRLRYLDRAGRVVHDQRCHYRFISYFTLYESLRQGIEASRYHLDCEIVGFSQSADEVEIHPAGRPSERCDLLVCADGIRSTARRQLMPDVAQVYAGYVGWRGTVLEGDLSEFTLRTLTDAITYFVAPETHILVYPIPNQDGSLEPGRRLMNWVWYRNVAPGQAIEELLTDRDGVRHSLSLAAGSVRHDARDELCAAAADLLPPLLTELVRKSPAPFVQAVVDGAVPRMAFGRVCLIGDAAFVLRPHIAVGTAKAAEDAWTLFGALQAPGDSVPAALSRWERGQLRLGRGALKRAREAGVRSQFQNGLNAGDPLPFGLYEAGDSCFPLEEESVAAPTRGSR